MRKKHEWQETLRGLFHDIIIEYEDKHDDDDGDDHDDSNDDDERFDR